MLKDVDMKPFKRFVFAVFSFFSFDFLLSQPGFPTVFGASRPGFLLFTGFLKISALRADFLLFPTFSDFFLLFLRNSEGKKNYTKKVVTMLLH